MHNNAFRTSPVSDIAIVVAFVFVHVACGAAAHGNRVFRSQRKHTFWDKGGLMGLHALSLALELRSAQVLTSPGVSGRRPDETI